MIEVRRATVADLDTVVELRLSHTQAAQTPPHVAVVRLVDLSDVQHWRDSLSRSVGLGQRATLQCSRGHDSSSRERARSVSGSAVPTEETAKNQTVTL